jgi:hypothetical protein
VQSISARLLNTGDLQGEKWGEIQYNILQSREKMAVTRNNAEQAK